MLSLFQGHHLRYATADSILKVIQSPDCDAKDLQTESSRTLENWLLQSIHSKDLPYRDWCDPAIDGDQNLKVYWRDLKTVVQSILHDDFRLIVLMWKAAQLF